MKYLGQFGPDFVGVVDYGEEMDEKVPESEDAPDDAEEEVQFVTTENDLCHLAVRSDLYDESGSGRGITFPLLVTIAVG